MTLPIDRSTLALAQGNQVPYQVASATKNINFLKVVADTIDELNVKVDAHAASALLPHTDGSVSTAKIADLAVTTPKLAPQAVTSSRIANGAVGALQLDPTLMTNFGDIAVQAEFDRRGINVQKFGVIGDGVDALGDTNRLQALVDYAIANKYDVYCPINLILQPILQADGTLVCIKFDDGRAATGNNRTPFKFTCKQGVVISTNNTTSVHTIFRWKLGDSVLEGFNFVGTKAYTTAIEISRISLTNITEADASTRNLFSKNRFVSCNRGITMEGSVYYNTFRDSTFYDCNRMIWLKPTYAMLNGLKAVDSGVNRNNFYNISGYACTRGILLDFGDTNKFYSSSFEGFSGTAIELNDQSVAYPGAQQTIYNTFYGVTNELNNLNLLYSAPYGNSFYDFESVYTKITLNYQPLVLVPSGDSGNGHLLLQRLVQTNDANVLTWGKNRDYSTSSYASYAKDFADYSDTLGTDGMKKVYNWREQNFTAVQCTNVTDRKFNSTSSKSAWKSMGGIVFWFTKFTFTPTVNTADIVIPLPIAAESNIYSFGNNAIGAVQIGYRKDSGVPIIIPALMDGTNLTIKCPAGNWSSTGLDSSNVIQISLQYPRTMPPYRDLN